MAVAPAELQRVPSDRLHILQHDQQGHIVRLQTAGARPLVYTGCAGTLLAEIPHGIDGLVSIIPFDTQHTLLNPGHVFWFTYRRGHAQDFLSTAGAIVRLMTSTTENSPGAAVCLPQP
jgi:hypothetical protein